MSKSTQPPGTYRKFTVNHTEGRDQPGGDRQGAAYVVHALAAARAYVSSLRGDSRNAPELADDLQAQLDASPLVGREVR